MQHMEVERHDVDENEDIIKVKEEIWNWIKTLNIKVFCPKKFKILA